MGVDNDEEDNGISTRGSLVTSISQHPGQHPQWHPSHKQSGSPKVSTPDRSKEPQPEHTDPSSPVQPVPVKSAVHRFDSNASHQDSEHLQGDMNVTPDSSHKGHDFVNNHSYDQSIMLSGSMDLEAVGKYMKGRRADKRKDKTEERKAAAAKSRGGITKRC